MIAFLTGRVAQKTPSFAIIEVAGIGYRLAMSTGCLAALPAEGDLVTVHTYMHVREDELSLFGFESEAEKLLFERLITVSGVGPKVALAALSSFAPDVLCEAIVAEDVVVVSSIPGVGAKTAQRIILDLKDKLVSTGDMAGALTGRPHRPRAADEAREALVAMGFTAVEAARAVKDYDGPVDDAGAVLRHGLKRLGGSA